MLYGGRAAPSPAEAATLLCDQLIGYGMGPCRQVSVVHSAKAAMLPLHEANVGFVHQF